MQAQHRFTMNKILQCVLWSLPSLLLSSKKCDGTRKAHATRGKHTPRGADASPNARFLSLSD